MYGVTRGIATLIGAAVAGFLVWAATRVAGPTVGDYWGVIGLLIVAGLVLALSQLLGGWTKWGRPRVSLGVLLVGFLPTLIATGWIILYAQPSANWFQRHLDSWSGTIGVGGLAHDLGKAAVVLAFGLGLVFGFIFDTSGPRTEPERTGPAPPIPVWAPDRKPVQSSDDTAVTRVDREPQLTGARGSGPEPGPGP